MTTRVTIQISHAHQPVDVHVFTRQRDGSFASPMTATRIEREGDVVTFHVHANQRLQVIEAERDVVIGDGSGQALPDFTGEIAERVGAAVSARRAKPVPPPLPAASAASPDDADAAAAGVNTSEDTDHA